jgi:hypothetical protein
VSWVIFVAVGLPVAYQIMAPAFGLPQFLVAAQ